MYFWQYGVIAQFLPYAYPFGKFTHAIPQAPEPTELILFPAPTFTPFSVAELGDHLIFLSTNLVWLSDHQLRTCIVLSTNFGASFFTYLVFNTQSLDPDSYTWFSFSSVAVEVFTFRGVGIVAGLAYISLNLVQWAIFGSIFSPLLRVFGKNFGQPSCLRPGVQVGFSWTFFDLFEFNCFGTVFAQKDTF